jgi:hypothetical protein
MYVCVRACDGLCDECLCAFAKHRRETCIHTQEYTQYTPAAWFDDVDVPVDCSSIRENIRQPIHASRGEGWVGYCSVVVL